MQQTIATAETSRSGLSETDQRFLKRALELAARGEGLVSPGPLVGCVIVRGGKTVGEGFYRFAEVKHAETLALDEAGALAKGATAYVSLEPHAHHGRTPPCTDALIAAGIARVVAPIEDPNPKVSGRGFTHLREVGIAVETGVMTQEASRLNEKYLHFMRTGRPFVHLKMAMSLDGKIATRTGDSRWITGETARARVHELRHEYDAIMIGIGTAQADDPLLTDRSNRARRLPLLRVVLDENLQLSPESQLARTTADAPVLVFTGEKNQSEPLKQHGVEIAALPGRNLEVVLDTLGQRGVQSLLLEGGAGVAGKFLDAGLVNKVSMFIAPMIVGGKEAPGVIGGTGAEKIADALRLNDVEVIDRAGDLEVTGYPAAK